ncbi:MAG: tagaturonate reductase [Clostridia bacterium]|nr:tagaturonate reductase [Clostridia bacterium]
MVKLDNKVYESLGKKRSHRPVKIMQFGEGNFLRAFLDWIFQSLDDEGIIDAGVAIVQPMPFGRVKELADQDGLYTLRLEGIDKGKNVKSSRIIDVVEDCINPFTEYERFLSYGESEDLQIIVSNTTEAGITLDSEDTNLDECPKSYPGKLLALLKRRYEHFDGAMDKGLAIVPCELIDNNGDELKRCLLGLGNIIGLDAEFLNWIENACHFTSTLVDRIVPGYPKTEIDAIQKETGYIDNNVVKGEIFHLWVLKKEPYIQKLLPTEKSGLNIIWADNIKPYKQRKVKILNGSHTAMVPVSYLCGIDTVGETLADPVMGKYVRDLVFSEINPTIDLPQNEMVDFANSVLERYQNPYIRHELMSIALNSTTKFTERLIPTLTDYVRIRGALPEHVCFSFAGLVVFHRGLRGKEKITLNDDPKHLEFWAKIWKEFEAEKDYTALAEKALGYSAAWKMDMNTIPGMTEKVAGYLKDILEKGMKAAVKDFAG